MGREIKFRVWDMEMHSMSDPFTLLDITSGDCKALITRDHGQPYTGFRIYKWLPEQTPVMQYTGLKDRNGTEIYEGDVLRGLVDFGPGGEHVRTFPVDITPYGPSFQTWPWCEGRVDAIPEVIGNVYENPELLTQPSDESDNAIHDDNDTGPGSTAE